MKPANPNIYFQTISKMMADMEEIGSEMNPYYEKIKKAKEDQTITDELLATVHTVFEQGVTRYNSHIASIERVRIPVKLMGLHQQFTKEYKDYVKACEDMVEAVDPEKTWDPTLFEKSETQQDEISAQLINIVTKMTKVLR